MPSCVVHSWEANKGFRYNLGDVSLLMQMIMWSKQGHRLEKRLSSISEELMDSLDLEAGFLKQPHRRHVHKRHRRRHKKTTDSKILEDDTFYKFVSDSTLGHLLRGEFRFGSTMSYSSEENALIADWKESFCHIFAEQPNSTVYMPVRSGFNFALLCGTHSLERKALKNQIFGKRIIRIKKISEFAERACELLGGFSYAIRKVGYNDEKIAAIDLAYDMKISGGIVDMSNELFKSIHSAGVFPSVFIKPVRFSSQQEVRLSIELGRDLTGYVDRKLPELVDYIEIVS
jgi:hypothetical protein